MASSKSTADYLAGASTDVKDVIGYFTGVPAAESAASIAASGAASEIAKADATKTTYTYGAIIVGLIAAAIIGVTLIRK